MLIVSDILVFISILANLKSNVRYLKDVYIPYHFCRLLFITIYEGPDTCSLIDNVKRGQATTVCNLIYRGLKKDIVQAVANHFTVFSSYSQYKHLQEGLEVFKKQSVKVKIYLISAQNAVNNNIVGCE